MDAVPRPVLEAANARSRRLRALVEAGRRGETLVMPGAFDALSARIFEDLGFRAIQVSSGAVAAVLGYLDGERLTLAQTVEASGRITAAASVPVNADGERGYGDARHMGNTVRAFIVAGCAGMNLEDGAPHPPGSPRRLVSVEAQVEKIAALMEARRDLGSEFFLNARVDALAVMSDDLQAALREAVARGQAYAAAGADCIFFMNAHTREVIGRLAREIPAPVSVLANAQTIPLRELRDLGVARVSYGTSFALAGAGAIRRLAWEILRDGTVTALQDAMPHAEVNRLMER